MPSWRTGTQVPMNVYLDDRPMFQCHTPEDAFRIVQLLNFAENLADNLEQLLAGLQKSMDSITANITLFNKTGPVIKSKQEQT